MVPTKSDNSRMVLSIFGDRYQGYTGHRVVPKRTKRCPVQQLAMSIFNLLNRELVIIRRDRYIPTIDNLEARQERIHVEGNVVATVEREPTRTCTNPRGTETRSRTIGSSRVKRST